MEEEQRGRERNKTWYLDSKEVGEAIWWKRWFLRVPRWLSQYSMQLLISGGGFQSHIGGRVYSKKRKEKGDFYLKLDIFYFA